MKKILHIRSSGQVLGAEQVVLELSKNLPSFGYNPTILVPVEGSVEPTFSLKAKSMGLDVINLGIKGAFDLSALPKLRRIIKEGEFKIIHTHGYREDFYAIFACFGLKGIKLIATNHLWKKTNTKLKLYAYLDAKLLGFFNKVIAVSAPILRAMEKFIPKHKLGLVPNGVSLDIAETSSSQVKALRQELGLQERVPTLLTLSSLTPEKGLHVLIDALKGITAKAPNVKLVIAGSGPEEDALRDQAKKSGVEHNIIFAGRREDANDILSVADIFIMPSLNEGLPISLLEAMRAGRCVIATNVGDVANVIDNNNGMLIKPNSANDIEATTLQLIEDSNKRRQLGKAALKTIRERFSSIKMAEEYAYEYDLLLDKRPTKCE